MKISKLKVKPLSLYELVELFGKAEDAEKYAEKFYNKLDGLTMCDNWASRIEACRENIILVQKEMRAKLEAHGAFMPLLSSPCFAHLHDVSPDTAEPRGE